MKTHQIGAQPGLRPHLHVPLPGQAQILGGDQQVGGREHPHGLVWIDHEQAPPVGPLAQLYVVGHAPQGSILAQQLDRAHAARSEGHGHTRAQGL